MPVPILPSDSDTEPETYVPTRPEGPSFTSDEIASQLGAGRLDESLLLLSNVDLAAVLKRTYAAADRATFLNLLIAIFETDTEVIRCNVYFAWCHPESENTTMIQSRRCVQAHTPTLLLYTKAQQVYGELRYGQGSVVTLVWDGEQHLPLKTVLSGAHLASEVKGWEDLCCDLVYNRVAYRHHGRVHDVAC